MAKRNEIEDPFALFEEEQLEEAEQAEPIAEPTPEPVSPELEQLREYKTKAEAEKREAEIASTFEKAGYTGKLAKLWAALNEGEPTAASVKAFADEYGVTPTRPVGYTPTLIQGVEPPTAKTVTRAEMEEIARENPARARALADAGRVKWNNIDNEGRPRR